MGDFKAVLKFFSELSQLVYLCGNNGRAGESSLNQYLMLFIAGKSQERSYPYINFYLHSFEIYMSRI